MNKKLNDPTLEVKLPPMAIDEPMLISEKFGKDRVNFTLGLNGKMGVSLFNSEGDEDPCEIFGKEGAIIPFRASSAWLKYEAECQIKLQGGLDVTSAGFHFDTNAGLKSYVYRIHEAGDTLEEAMVADVASLKTIFNKQHIKELKVDEAVGLEFAGALTASLMVSWADVWTTGFTSLTSLLDTAELVKIKAGAEASIKAKIQVNDGFRVQLIKKGNDKYWLRIKRSQSNTRSVAAALNIGVSIENPSVITEELESILDSVLGVSYSKLEKIASKASGEISKADLAILETVADRLGWGLDDWLEKLKEEVEGLREKYLEKVKEVVASKVKAGFVYEYVRITERENVFSAVLNGEALDQFYGDILKANVSTLIDFSINNPDSNLLSEVTFLSVLIKKRERSWGFSLGLGKFIAADSHKVGIEFVERKTEKGVQLSYKGQRQFEERLGQEKRRWRVDFNAAMPLVSDFKNPFASQFLYSLYLNYEWHDPRLDKRGLIDFLDLCRIWNIINEGQFSSLNSELGETLKKAKSITYGCHCTYGPELFKTMVMALGNKTHVIDNLFYESLGAALPYWEDFSIRKSPQLRGASYAGAWKKFIEDPGADAREVVYHHLKTIDKSLAKAEYNYKPNNLINFKSFAFLAKSNPQQLRRWSSFRKGISSLKEAIDPKAMSSHHPVIGKAFESMEDLWYFSHHLKAFGHLLVRVGQQYPVLFKEAVLTGEIKYKLNDKEEVIVFGKS